MKKYVLLVFVLILAMSLAACRVSDPMDTQPTRVTEPTNTTAATSPTILPNPTIETNIPDPSVDTSMPMSEDFTNSATEYFVG